jgi:gentisate 1,2-dioxygenase
MSTAANLVPSALETPCAQRALYWSAANNFQQGQPDVPSHVFVAERDRALDERTGTALIPLDLSGRIGLDYPATVPNLLARYVRVEGGDEIAFDLASSGEAYYVMDGGGEVEKGDDRFAWAAGDVFVLPGAGGSTRIRADGGGRALLWMVTDEPVLSYFGIGESPLRDGAGAVHYPAEAIEAEMVRIHQRVDDGKQSGKAVLFSRSGLEATHLATPTVAFAYNSLLPDDDQPPHRHNAAALTLCVQGEGVHSMVDGRKVDWLDRAVMVTPPSALHSHHNRGPEMMYSVVAQDGGVFYNARTLGYAAS